MVTFGVLLMHTYLGSPNKFLNDYEHTRNPYVIGRDFVGKNKTS